MKERQSKLLVVKFLSSPHIISCTYIICNFFFKKKTFYKLMLKVNFFRFVKDFLFQDNSPSIIFHGILKRGKQVRKERRNIKDALGRII